MKHKKPQIYTVTMAQMLVDWRTSQSISRYEVAKSTDININTIKQLEEGEGGISFEDGLRYFTYAESHKSKPNLMRKFRESMAAYQSEQDMTNVVMTQQKQREAEPSRKASERHKIEQSTRQAVQMEMEEQLTFLATQYNDRTAQLEADLKAAQEQMAAMEKEQQAAAEKHKEELEEAKRQGAEEAQQKFANMSMFECIRKK